MSVICPIMYTYYTYTWDFRHSKLLLLISLCINELMRAKHIGPAVIIWDLWSFLILHPVIVI